MTAADVVAQTLAVGGVEDHLPAALKSVPSLMEYTAGKLSAWVYFLCEGSTITYVGRAKTLHHLGQRIRVHERTKRFERVFIAPVAPAAVNVIERYFIDLFEPELNRDIQTMNRRGAR